MEQNMNRMHQLQAGATEGCQKLVIYHLLVTKTRFRKLPMPENFYT
jgi:hypothetical protein